jgi:hypothetical protein
MNIESHMLCGISKLVIIVSGDILCASTFVFVCKVRLSNVIVLGLVFFVGNKLAPVLIERKSIEDVAHSLSDGRWKRQQQSMRKAQFVLGGGAARKCQICYLIEGDTATRTVHGGFIGRRAWGQVSCI